MYSPKRAATEHDITIRKIRYRVHTWGKRSAKPVFLLHGWMDVGMSFQAFADSLSEEWFLIAPDWRGFGDTQWQTGGYWFPDYYVDLDELIEHFSPDDDVNLVGHSMGGHIAWMYAGICPQRVSHVLSLDAIGLSDTEPEEAPSRYKKWLEQCRDAPRFSDYTDIEQIEAQIQELAKYISKDYAKFVALHWSQIGDADRVMLKSDPAHKKVNPILYRREEAKSCWRNINAKVGLILGKESKFHKLYYEQGFQQDCQSCFSDLSEAVLENAGHMLHWEQPENLAKTVERFLRS